ncbi:MAG TPA: HAMP domain-containing sensor histidine kinase, partial [Chitinophagaceae bacterium]|nr:HAMP domain-containing sensor histidine kinase [Chitinophagaceae bacterium]
PMLIMDYAIQAVNVQASAKNIQLERQGDPMVPMVMADPEKTAWVLVNFLSNAIRYSPEGSRVLIGSYGQEGAVVFYVQDFGKGIDPKYREKIFEKFFRVPGSLSGGGTGLGLAISREFIQAQGGKVWVNSEPGKGSTFCFSLPAAPGLKASPQDPSPGLSGQSKK